MTNIDTAQYDTQQLWRQDRDHFIHPWTDFEDFKEKGSLVMTEGEGVYVYDSEGNRYIDGNGGLFVGKALAAPAYMIGSFEHRPGTAPELDSGVIDHE